jgi:DNA-binding response OmpR family regulator
VATAQVLVIEDEPELRDLLRPYLEAEGFTMWEAGTGPQGLAVLRAEPIDLVILDVMLPGLGGLEVLRQLRETSDLPVILLTARREEGHRIAGLRLGADDYVVKPFSAPELVARVVAQLRRVRGFDRPTTPDDPPTLTLGNITIDEAARTSTVAGEPIELTRREFDLLIALATRPGRVLSRTELLELVWGTTYLSAKTVDVHLAGLRRKLGPDLPIVTLRGVGYRLDQP